MPRQTSDKAPITFYDVADSFCEEEWKLLNIWQNELYKNVMNEIQQALLSLAPVIASSIFSLKAKHLTDLGPTNDWNFEGRHSDGQDPRHEVTEMIISASIKQEEENTPTFYQDLMETQVINCSIGSTSLMIEPNLCDLDPIDGDGRFGSSQGRPAHEATIATSASLKEEEETDPSFHQKHEENVNFPYSTAHQSEAECAKEIKSITSHQSDAERAKENKSITCKKHFTHKLNPKQHQRIHAPDRRFACTECEKRFIRKSCLVAHQRTHTGIRPFLCTCCEKSFRKKSHLVGHLRTHTGVRPFPCTECEKSFAQKSTLVQHQRIHTGERPYACSRCKKSFSRKGYLVQHQKIHTGVKPFHCTECDKKFVRKEILLRHMTMHRGTCNFVAPSDISTIGLENPPRESWDIQHPHGY